ncbi:MAG: TetR/AcrR family transcriptional regulator, partial [Thermotogaceae bacterium]|nr:TetR/AcrR family transcriptional regulator [Thermotogaceae bacterium]
MRIQSENLKKNVKERMLEAAEQLFAERCFSDVSILSITKKANVSNGSFYRYFSSKKDILKEIVEQAFNRLDVSLKVRGKCLESKLTRLIEDYLYFVEDNTLLCKVLHEAEYIETSILKNLKRILMGKLSEIGFKANDTFFWFFWGSVRFFAIWSYFWKKKIIDEDDFRDLMDFILHGVDPDQHQLDSRVFDVTIEPVELEQDTTKMKILQSAEKLFGAFGYKKTQISDITKNAGFAQGTFYLYFKTKQDVLKELVIRTNKAFRKTLKNVISNFKDRRDAEIAGYYAFLKFFRMH